MKKFIILSLLLFSTGLLSAKTIFDLGIKAGLTLSKLQPIQDWELMKSDMKFHVGAFSRIGWGRFYLQPEAYFNSRGGELKKVSNDPALNINANFDFSSIDVPLLAGIKVVKLKNFNARIMGGPILGFIASKQVEGGQSISNDYFNNHFYGWQVGTGVDFLGGFTFDVKYESSRNSVYQSSNLSARNNLFLFSVGMKLLFLNQKSRVASPLIK
jgi:hypothetical protein